MASSKPQYDEEPAADTKAEFLAQLRHARHASGLTGGQIAAKSGLARTTVYRYVSPDTTTIPRDVEQVERFLRACNMQPHEIRRCTGLWHEVNGNKVVVHTPKSKSTALITAAPQPTARMRGIVDAVGYLVTMLGTLAIPKLGMLLTAYDQFTHILSVTGGGLFGTAMGIWWSGVLSRRSSNALLTRVISWQTGVALILGSAAGLVVGQMVTGWWRSWWLGVGVPPAPAALDFGDALSRGVFTGLVFGVLATTLLSFWLRSVDWSALLILVRQFPVLPALAMLIAAAMGVLANLKFSYSITGSIVAALLLATALLFLLDKTMAQTLLAPIVEVTRDRRRDRRERQDAGEKRGIFTAATGLLGSLAQHSMYAAYVPVGKPDHPGLSEIEAIEKDTLDDLCADLRELKERRMLSFRQMEMRCRFSPFATGKTTLANAVKPSAGLPSLRTVQAFVWTATAGAGEHPRLAQVWEQRWECLARDEPMPRSDVAKLIADVDKIMAHLADWDDKELR